MTVRYGKGQGRGPLVSLQGPAVAEQVVLQPR